MNIETFNALAEPNRLRIIELLRDAAYPVGEIAERLALRQPQVSKHLRILSDAGVVKAKPNAQQRVYQLQSEPFQEISSWAETFKPLWNARLNALDSYLQELKQEEARDE